jgi:hypothetical protein
LPNCGQYLLPDADIAHVKYVVTVTVKTKTRGERLTSRSQLIRPYIGDKQKPLDGQFLGGVNGKYARGHLDIISEDLQSRRRTHPNS